MVKKEVRMREPKRNSFKSDYESNMSFENFPNDEQTEGFKLKFHNQSKQITVNMRDKVMKMIEEKNTKSKIKKKSKLKSRSKSRKKFLKPPINSKISRNKYKQENIRQFSENSPIPSSKTGIISPLCKPK